MDSGRRGSDFAVKISEQYPKDFNHGATGEWKDIIKQQQRLHEKLENKNSLKKYETQR